MNKPTLRTGSRGPAVALWQGIVGATADGIWGPATDAATRRWQAAHGLVADSVVGERSWREAGHPWAATAARSDPRAPACVAALRDADAAWPGRNRRSDGVMGDLSHQASKSDHNQGNAVDIGHDPDAGCDGNDIAALAIQDPRVTYVIWAGRIFNRGLAHLGWRKYLGRNGHYHHVHISIREDRRHDGSAWGWAP